MVQYIDVTVGSDPGTASSGATTAGTLSAAIAQLNASDPAGGPYVIRLDTDVSLSGPLSPILGSVTIEGNGHTIDAGGATRIFFVGTDRASQSEFQSSILSQRQKVTIADVTLTGGTAQGGAGGSGGGGGLGAGGALFVNQSADVTLSNVTFSGDGATIDLEGMVGGRGTLDVEANSILELGAMIGAAQTAQFGSDGGTLDLMAPSKFAGTISGFSGTDTIDVAGFSEFTSVLFKANAGDTGGTLTLADASHSVALHLAGQYTSANFTNSAGGVVRYQ